MTDTVFPNPSFGTTTIVQEGDSAVSGSTGSAADAGHDHGWPWKYSRLKPPVKFATVASLPGYSYSAGLITASANGALTIDGSSPALNDRILVKDEWGLSTGTPSINGIYTLTQVGDGTHPFKLTRATDYDETTEIDAGTMVEVQRGATNGGVVFKQVVPSATLDTDALVFMPSDWDMVVTRAHYATAAVLPNSPTYSANVLTAGANAALVVDGQSPALNNVILVKNQATGSQNGLYYVSAVGSGAAPWTLTRVSWYSSTNEIRAPWLIVVAATATAGTNDGTRWVQTAVDPVLDTTALVYATAINNTGAGTPPGPQGLIGFVLGDSTNTQTTITTEVDITNLTTNVYLIAGRRYRITMRVRAYSSVGTDSIGLNINIGGTNVDTNQYLSIGTANGNTYMMMYFYVPATTGQVTIKGRALRAGGTGNITISNTSQRAYLAIEDVGA